MTEKDILSKLLLLNTEIYNASEIFIYTVSTSRSLSELYKYRQSWLKGNGTFFQRIKLLSSIDFKDLDLKETYTQINNLFIKMENAYVSKYQELESN